MTLQFYYREFESTRVVQLGEMTPREQLGTGQIILPSVQQLELH